MRQYTRKIVLASVFAALVFVVTAYLPRFPIPPGYIHFGDVLIYIAACLLPPVYAAAAAAVGAATADMLTGYAVWAPATLVIKAAITLVFSSRSYKITTARNLLATAAACLIGTAGYYTYEAFIISDFAVALESVPFNIIQGVGSAVIFAMAAVALDKADIRRITEMKEKQ